MMRAAVVLGLAACGFPAIDGEVVTDGRHVTVHAAPTLPVCSASIARADAFIDEAVAFLEALPAPEIDYYLHDGTPSGCRLIGTEATSCTHYETIHTDTWIHYHEVVHAIARDWGRPPAFLLEGLAEGIGTSYPQLTKQERANAEIVLDSALFYSGDHVGENYAASADFAVYLLRRFGATMFHELSTSLLYLADELTTRATFRRITGVKLDDAVAAWRVAEPPRSSLPIDHIGCGGSLAMPPTSPDSWSAEDAPFDCQTGTTAAGGRLSQPVHMPIDVVDPGLFATTATFDGLVLGAYLSVDACGTADRDIFQSSHLPHAYQLGALSAGRHLIDLAVDRDEFPAVDPLTTTWSVQRLGAESATCENAPVFTAPPGPWSVTYESDPNRLPGRANDPIRGVVGVSWVRFDLPSDTLSITFTSSTGPMASSIQVCSGPCDAPIKCALAAGTFVPVPGQPMYLSMAGSIASNDIFVTATRD